MAILLDNNGEPILDENGNLQFTDSTSVACPVDPMDALQCDSCQ